MKTGNPETLLDQMDERGTCFYASLGEERYRVLYFATNREVHFEGKLTKEELAKVQDDGQKAKSIEVDDFAGEIIIEE